MADDPWAFFAPVAAPTKPPDDPWSAFSPVAAPAAAQQAPSGKTTLLPFIKDASGNVVFDSNAGIVGTIKRALTLPGEVYRGEIDPRSGEGMDRAMEMAGVVTPINPAVRAGGGIVPGMGDLVGKGMVPVRPTPPTFQELKSAGAKGLDEVRDSGIDFAPAAIKSMADETRLALDRDGILAQLAPKSAKILDDLASPPADATAMPISGLVAARRALGHARKDIANPTEQLAANRIIAGLDDFIQTAPPEAVLAGAAAAERAGQTLRNANANYAAGSRSQKLNKIEDVAELRAAAANSGRNSGNATRGRIASLLADDKSMLGFDAAERAALEKVVRGSRTRNAARGIGSAFGGGGGLGAHVASMTGAGLGAILGGYPGAAAGAAIPAGIGFGARSLDNRLTSKAFTLADELVRGRSPLAQSMPPKLEAASPGRRSALLRYLLSGDYSGRKRR